MEESYGIVTDRLTKQFKETRAVDNLSFNVRKGEIFGLLGENGAGKSTTMRVLSTMLKPTGGTAKIAGYELADGQRVRAEIGILFGGEAGLYDRLSARENIAYFAALNGMNNSEKRIDELARAFGFTEFLDRKASKLSKGTRQKVVFARAVVHNPSVMLFDEPTSGLDVTAIRDAHDFILSCRSEGKSILLSSHTMSEVERLCDRICIIHKGVMQDIGTKDELLSRHGRNTMEEVFEKLVKGERS